MGLDYSYEIFLPARNIPRALDELVKLVPPARSEPALTLTLPGREQLLVPFTSRFKHDPVDCSTGEDLELDTVLRFELDEAVREYHLACNVGREQAGLGTWELDESGRAAIGYIYLTARFSPKLHPHWASLQFTAATSDMSRLFERSASARRTFTGLARDSGAVCCLLDTETDTFQICWLNGRETDETVPGPRFATCRELVAAWSEQM